MVYCHSEIKHKKDVIFDGIGLTIKEPELVFPNELRPCIESFVNNRKELEPIFDIHYDELSLHKKQGYKLSPDWDAYTLKELKGELLFIALRKQGKIIGYFSGFIGRALHYDCLSLALDIFYVIPEMRGKRNGNAGQVLINAVKVEAKRRGVCVWTMGRKTHVGKHLEQLLIQNGFEPFEVHYALWIK